MEFFCRTYGWSIEYVLDENAVRLALLYRCYSQGVAGLMTATFEEEVLMAKKVKQWASTSSEG